MGILNYFTNGKANKAANDNSKSLEEAILKLLQSITENLSNLNVETANITEDTKTQVKEDVEKVNERILNAKNAIIRIVSAKLEKKEIDKKKWENFLKAIDNIKEIETKNIENLKIKIISENVKISIDILKNIIEENQIDSNNKNNKEKSVNSR